MKKLAETVQKKKFSLTTYLYIYFKDCENDFYEWFFSE